MGDRNTIVIHEPDAYNVETNPLYLYSHWMGQHLDQVVCDALRKGRTNDPAYFTRIVFSTMVQDDIHGTTSFGIAQTPQDHDSYNHMIHVKWHGDWGSEIYLVRDGKTYSKEGFLLAFDKTPKEETANL